MNSFDLTYLSLGAGVQSTAMLICSNLGLHGVPKADVAIFADTQAEIKDTYDHLERLKEWSKIPVDVVTDGSLETFTLEQETRSMIPAFTRDKKGKRGRLMQKCTDVFKIRPIRKGARAKLGLEKGARAKGRYEVLSLIGISTDEAGRATYSDDSFILFDYPLIKAGLNRQDCIALCRKYGFSPPKSACLFCPYHRNDYWAWLQSERPETFARAVAVDRRVRDLTAAGIDNPAYLHDSLLPLEDVDFAESHQLRLGFEQECKGMCGV